MTPVKTQKPVARNAVDRMTIIGAPNQTGANRGQFKPGESGNPAGRPKGARSKLSESFLKALSEDFDSNGIEVIEKVRSDRPHEYLKIVAAVLPKQMQLEDLTPKRKAEDLSDDELASIAAGNA
jgi:Family of unknown function (DUF5681)